MIKFLIRRHNFNKIMKPAASYHKGSVLSSNSRRARQDGRFLRALSAHEAITNDQSNF